MIQSVTFMTNSTTRVLQKVLSLGLDYFSATFYQTYTERKKKRRVNFIPKFHSSLKMFVKYFTMTVQNGTCMEQKFKISLVCDQQVSSY